MFLVPSLRIYFLNFFLCCLTFRSILYFVFSVFLLVGFPLPLFESFTIVVYLYFIIINILNYPIIII